MRKLLVVLHYTGPLLVILGVLLLLPLIVALIYGEGQMVSAFLFPAGLSLLSGLLLFFCIGEEDNSIVISMFVCVVGWALVSLFGSLPFTLGLEEQIINGLFEAVSGFTTTGMTIFSDLCSLPHALLFWRGLMQWLGGLGILTFFLAVTFRGQGGLWHLYAAESHKSNIRRPVPNIFKTVEILWIIYLALTALLFLCLLLLRVEPFDAVVHAMTTLSTGGFSNFDASIAHFSETGHPFFRQIEYLLIIFMLLGGTNFLVHYQVFQGDWREIWRWKEMKYYWGLLLGCTLLVLLSFIPGGELFSSPESIFRKSLFQVASLLSSTCYLTVDLFSPFFSAFSRLIFLVLMFVGGSVGSTASGFKVLRLVILKETLVQEVRRIYYPRRSVHPVVIDGEIISREEMMRTVAIFMGWLVMILIGSGVTALLSHYSSAVSLSVMLSVVGNMGPVELSVDEIRSLSPVLKGTYMLGMLAGRLEILPLLLFFSPRAWSSS